MWKIRLYRFMNKFPVGTLESVIIAALAVLLLLLSWAAQ